MKTGMLYSARRWFLLGIVCAGFIDGAVVHAQDDCTPSSTPLQCYQAGLAQVGKALGEIRMLKETLTKQIEALEKRTENLENKIPKMQRHIENVEKKITDANTVQTSMNGRLTAEEKAVRYIFSDARTGCPKPGWTNLGYIGFLLEWSSYTNNLGIGGNYPNGGVYGEGWSFTHPVLCRRN
jgi:hypothetical protein